MVDRCMRTDSSRCDPSRITLDLRARVIWLGSQLDESLLMHLSTIPFSLNMPWYSGLHSKPRCGTHSNALEKSSNANSTCFLTLIDHNHFPINRNLYVLCLTHSDRLKAILFGVMIPHNLRYAESLTE